MFNCWEREIAEREGGREGGTLQHSKWDQQQKESLKRSLVDLRHSVLVMKAENVMIILSELEISMPARIPPARYPAYHQGIGEVPTEINVVFMSSHYTQLMNTFVL